VFAEGLHVPGACAMSEYINRTVNGRSGGEHVHIAERALGKELPKGAEVHHVDGNGRNNANRNLVICQDASYHRLLHRRAKALRELGDANATIRMRTIKVKKSCWYQLKLMSIAEGTTIGEVLKRLVQEGR
jgi:hypothetical protein